MKKARLLGATHACVLALITSAFATPAIASTVYAPTDGDINFIYLSGDTTDLQLGIFDDSDPSFGGSFLDVDVTGDIVDFGTGPIGEVRDYTITNNANESFVLSDSDRFLIALNDTSDAGGFMAPTTADCTDVTNICTFTWALGLTTLSVDIQLIEPPAAIPVPPAVWLFGSGLLGLIGVARRKVRV